MTANYQVLREEITRSRGGQGRWRCPVPLRGKVIACTRERQGEGVSVIKVAKASGVSESGLKRWLHLKKPGQFRPVRLTEVGG